MEVESDKPTGVDVVAARRGRLHDGPSGQVQGSAGGEVDEEERRGGVGDRSGVACAFLLELVLLGAERTCPSGPVSDATRLAVVCGLVAVPSRRRVCLCGLDGSGCVFAQAHDRPVVAPYMAAFP
ncbi:hypothetical protein [Actinomadura spongiicola]|uniref:hypothetical protein n=1 Tax=Actinomadura spongiicola TaxID=2303421 RepID=UPI0011C160C7|nr:hypothetical protein [Actinomadura spongiicola]